MHYKQNNKETKSYVQGLRPFGNTLPRGIRGILRKNGYNYSEIITKWKILIEKDISDFSYPISIKMSKKGSGAVLLIGVKRGNEITLEYSKKDETAEAYFILGSISLFEDFNMQESREYFDPINELIHNPRSGMYY